MSAATLQHIALLAAKRQRLLAAQIKAEEQFAHAVAREWGSGELTKNWRPWHSPNGPAGSWFGECPLNDGEPLPPKWTCVVYVLFDHENVPCYVGSTNQFRQRVKRHAYDGKRFVRWVAYPCADREAAFDLEVKLLAEHKPYLNVKAGR